MRGRSLTALFTAAISILLLVSFSIHLSPTFSGRITVATAQLRFSSASALHCPIHQLQNLAISDIPLPSPLPKSVLLPNWEVLLLPPPHQHSSASVSSATTSFSCIFVDGATSPARPLSYKNAFICPFPSASRRRRPFLSPRLSTTNPTIRQMEMFRWNRLAYESLSTAEDLILFTKGVKIRPGLRCVFLSGDTAVTSTNVTQFAQEVFRCPHPDRTILSSPVSVSIDAGDGRGLFPSLASYRPRELTPPSRRVEICACTMVYNVAKFLREWVLYHAAVGVDRFLLYDNGSNDGLAAEIARLGSDGFDVQTRFWPWPKTQEAGFSHCAVANRGECAWIAFLDVDEFVFNPVWGKSSQPHHSMLRSITTTKPMVGQVSIPCLDFGPTGHRSHPRGGVTQGYTCRLRAYERHKSLVRPEAVAASLANSVHHFDLGEGWKTSRLSVRWATVNHYKYQVWEEFKVKFRRRVSAYVVDWQETVNLSSKDRTPGLGFEAVEPRDWAGRFCEVKDSRLRNVTRNWFRKLESTKDYKMAWELT